MPAHMQDNEKIQEQSQQVDDGEFASRINTQDSDLGSREVIRSQGKHLIWYPAEVNTSIRRDGSIMQVKMIRSKHWKNCSLSITAQWGAMPPFCSICHRIRVVSFTNGMWSDYRNWRFASCHFSGKFGLAGAGKRIGDDG